MTGIGTTDNVHVSVTTEGVALPIDMIVAIGEHLNVIDWPHLFCTNRAINGRYREDQIGYAKSLCKIGSALRLSEIIDALATIANYTPGQQPYLLRALAQNIRMQTHGPAYGATIEWANQIDAQFDWHAARPPCVERERALQQLIIARGFALAERRASSKGEDFHSIVGERMSAVSPAYWPPIFEAFLASDNFLDLLAHCKFKAKFNNLLPSISPKFGLIITFEFLSRPHDYTDVSMRLRHRLRLGDVCAREILDPMIAIAIANASLRQATQSRNAWLMHAILKWRSDDQKFASLVTDTFVRLFDDKVYRNDSFSFLFNDNFTVLPELAHKVRERTILLERPTIDALRNTVENAEEHVGAFLKMIDKLGDRLAYMDCVAVLDEVGRMPLVTRPALLHRFILNVQIGWNDLHIVHAIIDAAIACRDALISSGAHNGPLISRVSAALILTAIDLRSKHDSADADAVVAEAGDVAFSHTAPEDWGDVLQALIYDNRHGSVGTADRWERIDKHIAVFVCLPGTSARHLLGLLNRIEKIAGSVWAQLPDKADGIHSRFEVFKHRVGMNPEMGQVALASIAESLVPKVVAGVHFIEDVAGAADFDDPDAIRALETALFERTIRPSLHADSDIDAITNHYTKRSLYLRSRVAEAVYDLRMLSDFHGSGRVG